jgi:hypothetical protein
MLVPLRAMGQTSSVSIRWTAPANCPSGDAVRQRVLSLASPSVVLDASADVTEVAEGFRADLQVKVGPAVGSRVIVLPTCDELAQSVAVILAMSATADRSEPPPAPPPPPRLPEPLVAPPTPAPVVAPKLAPNAPVPPPLPQEKPSSSTPARPHVRIAALGSADVGTLPVPTVGVGARVSVLPTRSLALAVAGNVWEDQTGFAQKLPTQGAKVSLFSVDVSGCYALPLRIPVVIAPCLLVDLADASAKGIVMDHSDQPTALWASIGLGAHTRWEIGCVFALSLELEALVPTVPQEFQIGPGTTGVRVYEVSPVTGRIHFGPEVRF